MAGYTYIASNQGGITCGAIDEPRKSSKAIDERVIINLREKNVVIARLCDKNDVIARLRDKCSFTTKQCMFGVFAIDEILCYR